MFDWMDVLIDEVCAAFEWTHRQLRDGTVTFETPTGYTYAIDPDGGALFPALAVLSRDVGSRRVGLM